jgi:NADPH2:quinone reductase
MATLDAWSELGAKVIACAGSPEKLEVAKRLGQADYAIDYTKVDWVKEVKAITGGRGVDLVYDPVGMVDRSLSCIAWSGRIVVIGFAAGTIEKVRFVEPQQLF